MVFFRGPIIAKPGIYFTFQFVDWSPALTLQFIFILLLQKLSTSLNLATKKSGACYWREDISNLTLGANSSFLHWGIADLASTEQPQVSL